MSAEIENIPQQKQTTSSQQFIEIQSSITLKYLKQIVGKNVVISSHFKNDFSKILTIFLLYVNSLSNEIAKERNSKTTSISDIKKVLYESGFEELVEKMQDFEEKITKTSVDSKTNLKRKRVSNKVTEELMSSVEQNKITENEIEIEDNNDIEEDLMENDLENEKQNLIQRLDFNNVEQENEDENNIDKEVILSDDENIVDAIVENKEQIITEEKQLFLTNNNKVKTISIEEDEFD